MIRQELNELKTGPRELRKFGLTVGLVFVLLGAWCGWRHKPTCPYFLAAGVPLILLGLARPTALRRVYLGWMAAALVLGLVVSTALLTLFFYLVVTPIGWIARLTGQDFLNHRLDRQAKSYWLNRDPSNPRSPVDYERQF